MFGRFAKYLERNWDFVESINQLWDDRVWFEIPTSAVVLSCFGMFALRLPSFNALEEEFHLPKRWSAWVGNQKPSADTLGYVLERLNVSSLREFLRQINHQAKRKKIFKSNHAPYIIAAVDGHELFCSRKRCCERCLERRIETSGDEATEYYHRVVVLQIVDAWPSLILDFELLLPGEGEVTAAQRLLERAKKLYPRFFDILTFDALYLQAPFLKKVVGWGWDAVIVLKQENRELYQDVDQLMQITRPEIEKFSNGQKKHWDLQELTTWQQLGQPIRVICSQETKNVRERIAKAWKEKTIVQNWKWATTLSPKLWNCTAINRIGHARWDEETRGFMELSQYWPMNHCFHHHPNAILSWLLILAQVFILTSVFYQRNLKPALRNKICRQTLARLFADDLSYPCTTSFWPHPP